MANKTDDHSATSIGGWAKRCYLAGRGMMEDTLRPHGLGSTQWYVLHQLTQVGPTMQRDLVRLFEIERATVSIVVGTLVQKGLVEQIPDASDQRQKSLCITPAGKALWDKLPDLAFIHDAAFAGFSEKDIETTVRVLQAATQRLNERLKG